MTPGRAVSLVMCDSSNTSQAVTLAYTRIRVEGTCEMQERMSPIIRIACVWASGETVPMMSPPVVVSGSMGSRGVLSTGVTRDVTRLSSLQEGETSGMATCSVRISLAIVRMQVNRPVNIVRHEGQYLQINKYVGQYLVRIT